MAEKVSVLLVDDHAVVREGYRRLLERHGDISVVGEAGDAASAYSLFCSSDPQIVVMDVTLPGSSGIEVARRMLAHRPHARILMFSMHEDTIFATRALHAGAFGYVTKASAPNVLVEAIRSIARGRKYLSPEMAQRLALRSIDAAKTSWLSQRELEVLRRLSQGQTIAEIAESMGVSTKTIANHQSVIKHKLGVETVIQLVRKATQLGLLVPGDSAPDP
jgi:two-component system, NarL family, invasion response regulator UvrY